MGTYAESNNRRIVRLDRGEIVGDDSHFVVINAKLLNSCTAGIDQAKSMGFATGELEFGEACVACTFGAGGVGAVKIHLAVDEIAVGCRSDLCKISSHDILHDVKVISMVVVSHSHRPEVYVVVQVLWSMDDKGSP